MFFLTILKNIYVTPNNSLQKQTKIQSTENRTQNTEQNKIVENQKVIETNKNPTEIFNQKISDSISDNLGVPWYEKPPYINEEKIQPAIREYKNKKIRQFKNNYYKGIVKSKNK